MADMPDKIEIPMHIFVAGQAKFDRWEYQAVCRTRLDEFIAELNKLGAEGWQVCQHIGTHIGTEYYLLIRQVIPDPGEQEQIIIDDLGKELRRDNVDRSK